MKVAVIHDWLVVKGGAESVLTEILAIYPNADVFTLVDFLGESRNEIVGSHRVITSFIQRLPLARKHYRSYLPLMPIAIEQFDLSSYDIVISSSYAVAKGVLTGPHQLHISYIHSPLRYAWDLHHQYLKESNLNKGARSVIARAILHYMRIWDARSSNGVDVMIANSQFVQGRIMKAYRRSSLVVYPPVNLDAFPMRAEKEDFYVTASRMVPYKRIPMIVSAFSATPERRLVVIGDGPELPQVEALAGSNVSVLGFQPRDVLADYLGRAKAFVFAAEEDFGIAPLEAQACGTPVIALNRGGVRETIKSRNGVVNGVFYPHQTSQSLSEAIDTFERTGNSITALACRANAERFGVIRFRAEIRGVIASSLESWNSRGFVNLSQSQ